MNEVPIERSRTDGTSARLVAVLALSAVVAVALSGVGGAAGAGTGASATACTTGIHPTGGADAPTPDERDRPGSIVAGSCPASVDRPATAADRPASNETDRSGAAPVTTTDTTPPTADFTFSPVSPSVGDRVTFDGSPSEPPTGGEIVGYEWDLDGDGDFEESGREVTTTYETGGTRTVTLRVVAANDRSDTATLRVSVAGTAATATATATPTATPTETPTATPTETPTTTTPGGGDDDSGSLILAVLLGGVIVVGGGLAVAGLVLYRVTRDDDDDPEDGPAVGAGDPPGGDEGPSEPAPPEPPEDPPEEPADDGLADQPTVIDRDPGPDPDPDPGGDPADRPTVINRGDDGPASDETVVRRDDDPAGNETVIRRDDDATTDETVIRRDDDATTDETVIRRDDEPDVAESDTVTDRDVLDGDTVTDPANSETVIEPGGDDAGTDREVLDRDTVTDRDVLDSDTVTDPANSETVIEPDPSDSETVIEPDHAGEETVIEPDHASEETVIEPDHASEETVIEPDHANEETVIEPDHANEETVIEPDHANEETVIEPGSGGSSDDARSVLPAQEVAVVRDDITVEKPIKGDEEVHRVRVETDGGSGVATLKTPRPDDGAAGEAFAEEVASATETWHELDHEGIVDVVGSGRRPVPWVLTEYANGGNLRDALPLPVPAGVDAIIELTRAVEYAHDRGVVHGDIRPSNVLFRTADGRPPTGEGIGTGETTVMVDDWKLSEVLIAHAGPRDAGSPYAAPEQVSDGRRDPVIHHSADVYQIGAITYEVLTGRPPFEGTLDEVMRKIETEDPVPPTELNPDLPGTADEVIVTAMAKDPRKRYESVAELRQALEILRNSL